MIRVEKPPEIPRILQTRGEREKLAMCEAYENENKRDFEFNPDIYGDSSVKEALILAQKDKCFLCESKVTHIDYGDVEHFRPKKAYRQDSEEVLNYPGYYWLAYDLDNLFLACTLCNQRYKENLFPLENRADRAISHLSNLDDESPLFIDPSKDDPEDYISFRIDALVGVVPFAKDGNPKGLATIKGAGIDRLKLCEYRMTQLKPILALHKIASLNIPQPESDEAKAELQAMIEDITRSSHEYAGMFRAAVRSGFKID